MSKTFIEWMATETPTRWCVDRGNVVDVKKAIAQGFEFGAGNPLLTLKSIKMEWDRMEKEVEDTRHLKGKSVHMNSIAVTCSSVRSLMPVFEKYESGNRADSALWLTPMLMTTKKWSKLVLRMSKWARTYR